MEASLTRFDNHRCLSYSKESKCMWAHSKECTIQQFWIRATKVGVGQEEGRSGGDGGKIE